MTGLIIDNFAGGGGASTGIEAALVAAGGSMRFDQLADKLYPDPASHRAPSRGGPPGCYRALSAALDKHNFAQHSRGGTAWCGRMVYAHGVEVRA